MIALRPPFPITAGLALAVACAVTVTAGCRPPAPQPASPPPAPATSSNATVRALAASATARPLAGTRWRLVEIHSMDDAAGSVRPDDASAYTMQLREDGSVAMRLNCNRATGEWSAAAGPEGSSGRFEFGPLAVTRALCPPPSLDERVSGQAQYVRSYLLKDGRLHLSLMADGGIFVWEPDADVPFDATPDRDIEAAILRASPSYTRALVDLEGGAGRGRYVYGRVDLNGDGRDEVLVYLLGSFFCGTGGCNLLLLTGGGREGFVLVDEFPISRLPVVVSATRTNGWNDLVRMESGGGAKPTFVRHTFDGTRYVEAERTDADTIPEGTRLLVGELTFDKGVPLEPRDGR